MTSILLYEGLGDTIGISMTAHPREGVIGATNILKSLRLRKHVPSLWSCPGCGRTEAEDYISLVGEAELNLAKIKKSLRVAVMGCIINGPGESRDADIGVACGKNRAVLFKKGQIIRIIEKKDILYELFKEIDNEVVPEI